MGRSDTGALYKGSETLLFPWGKKAEVQKRVKELQVAVLGQSFKFSFEVEEQHRTTWEEIRSSGAFPEDDFVLSNIDSRRPRQIIMNLEALCFFLHALDLATFRSNTEVLSELIYDPTVEELSLLYARVLADKESNNEERVSNYRNEVINLIYARAQFYTYPRTSFMGENPDDKDTAFWRAKHVIAESVGRPKTEPLLTIIGIHLLNGLMALKFAERTKAIEELLQ